MERKRIIIIVIAIAVLAVAAIVGWYAYEGARYVATDDARVAADVVSVSPEIVGKLLEWRVKEGDMVAKDDVLGRQDLGAALTSAALNPQLMGSVAGVMAEKAVLKAPIAGQVIPIKVSILDRGEARLMVGMNASIRISVQSSKKE